MMTTRTMMTTTMMRTKSSCNADGVSTSSAPRLADSDGAGPAIDPDQDDDDIGFGVDEDALEHDEIDTDRITDPA